MRDIYSGIDASIISFPDCHITGFEVLQRGVRFCSDGIYIDGHGTICDSLLIHCTAIETLRVRRLLDRHWKYLDWQESGSLREICEWTSDGKVLKFAGFERDSGAWQEYLLVSVGIRISAGPESPSRDRPG